MLLTNRPSPPVPIRNSTDATLRIRKQAKIGRPVANSPSSAVKISSSVIHQVMSDFRNDLIRSELRPEEEVEDGGDQSKADDDPQTRSCQISGMTWSGARRGRKTKLRTVKINPKQATAV